MRIEIDQSGKLEDTHKPTVVGFSNSLSKTILVLSRDKIAIQKYYRKKGQPKIYVFKLFAVLIYILTESLFDKIDEISIDKEYPGYEKLIRSFILEIAQKNKKKFGKEQFKFKSLGKKSKAHKISNAAYRSKKADIKLTYNTFKKFIYK